MLLNFDDLCKRYDLSSKVTGVLHCGARLGEEARSYDTNGIKNVWWVEANPNVIKQLTENVYVFDQKVISALLWSEDNVELPFHVTNFDGLSSSILPFGTHTSFAPNVKVVENMKMQSTTIDTLFKIYNIQNINMLVMDLQGVEGRVLRGANHLLPNIDFVMSEVNRAQVYQNCTQIKEMDSLLFDFERTDTCWVENQGWGDAFWVRKNA